MEKNIVKNSRRVEKHIVKNDIKVLCKLIPTFPDGIQEGFDELAERFGKKDNGFYGISYMDENGKIIYYVAISISLIDQAAKKEYESFTIPKGDYLSVTMVDWMSKTDEMKDIFGDLMQDPRFDDSVPCIEWYENDKEMQCWVKMKAK